MGQSLSGYAVTSVVVCRELIFAGAPTVFGILSMAYPETGKSRNRIMETKSGIPFQQA